MIVGRAVVKQEEKKQVAITDARGGVNLFRCDWVCDMSRMAPVSMWGHR
jgi:hypothetical protein